MITNKECSYKEYSFGIMLKLNLGCKDTKIKGFKNVDINKGKNVDIVSDVKTLPFKDNKVDEIYASHILEHISWKETNKVLSEWYRVLKHKGIIYISVPNFDFIIESYNKYPLLNNWLVQFIYGEHTDLYQYHKTIFNWNTLLFELNQVGFKNIVKIEDMPYEVEDASKLIYMMNKKSISIHIKAVK